MSDIEYAIIGGGVVGRSIARALNRRTPHEIVVIEGCSRDRVENQSTRNSGVIHAGIYYKRALRPHKARFCVEGNALLYSFCEEFDVRHARCGKLVVATDAEEERYLDDVYQTALENQVPGIELVSGAEARQREPGVVATRALHAPSSGVIDAADYLEKLRFASKAHSLFATKVVGLETTRGGFRIQTISGSKVESFVAQTVINAAGLYADEVARLLNPESPYSITPVRGEAAKFYKTRRPELAMKGMNVYPVPCGFYVGDGRKALLPFDRFQELLAQGEVVDTLGVHLTPTLDDSGTIAGTVTVGPSITMGVDKEDYGSELHPPQFYWERVRTFFPGLRAGDLQLHQTGIQARLRDHLDWIIEPDAAHPRFINLIGIDSPGLTASLAIARYVVDEILAA